MQLEDVVRSLLGVLPTGKKGSPAPGLTRDQALEARPVRNPSLEWQELEDGEVEVLLTRRQDLTGRILGWAFMVPTSRPVRLDEVGATVWQHCDGQHTVADLVKVLAAKYQMGKREVELSLVEYLKTLGKRGMVAFVVPEELAAQAGRKSKS